jgi:transposase
MLNLGPATRVFVALTPVDLRKSFDGLSALVSQVLAQSPGSGHLYVFTNRTRNRLKVLCWDGSGYWCCAKRLERGRFLWPQGEGTHHLLRPEEWGNLVQGLDVVRRAGWYRQ